VSDRTDSSSPERGEPGVAGADFAGIRDALPVVARGNSLVLATPPAAGYAVPVLVESLKRPAVEPATAIGLLIAPEGAVEPWVAAAGRAAEAAGRRSAGAATAARARHHLSSGRVDLVVTTLVVAGHLLEQSGLEVDRLGWVVLAWPELEPDADGFVRLFADLPKETPRLIVTADPAGIAPLAERHAWRAARAGTLGSDPTERLPRLRAAGTSWSGRVGALAALADLTGRDEATVWTVDEADHQAIGAGLAAHGVTARFVSGTQLDRSPTWFFDAAPPAALAAADPVHSVVLAPPGVERYLARVAARVDPVSLPSDTDAATAAIAADRRAVRARVQAGPDRGAFATIAPLLDQFPAADVAVALQSLWLEARAGSPAPAPQVRAARPAKVWISAGKKDAVGTTDVIGLLTGELKLARHAIGRVEVRDTFTLIESTSEDDAKALATKLAGLTLKGRRLTARVDRGPGPRRPA